MVAVLIELDRFVQGKVTVELLLRGVTISHHKPRIGMGEGRVCHILKGLQPFLGQAVVTGSSRIFLARKIQQNIIHCFLDLWIFRKRFVLESGRIPEWKFFFDGLEILMWVCELLSRPICKGHSPHYLVLLGHFLLPLIIAV